MVTSFDRLLKPQYLESSYPLLFFPSHQKFNPSKHSSESSYVSRVTWFLIMFTVMVPPRALACVIAKASYLVSWLHASLPFNSVSVWQPMLLLKGKSEDTSSVLKALQWAPLPPDHIFGTLLGLLLSRYILLCSLGFCTGFPICLEWSLLSSTAMMLSHLFLVFTNNLRDAFSVKSK